MVLEAPRAPRARAARTGAERSRESGSGRRLAALLIPANQTGRFPAGPAALFAIVGGLLAVLSFPEIGLWWTAPLAVAALSIAVHGQRLRRSAWLGYLWGAAFFLPLLHWTSTFVGAAPWLILALAEAAFIAALGPVLTLLQRLPAWPAWIGPAWVAQEAARDRLPFGGFPWGRIAFSQADAPTRWFAALGGAPAVTAVIGLSGGALAYGVLRAARGGRAWRSPVPLLAIVGAGAVLASGWAIAPLLRPPIDGPHITVALIQGDVPDRGLEFNARRRQVLDNHVNQTLLLAADIASGKVAKPDLVVWPENSSDIDPYDNADAGAEITKAVQAVGVPILVGALLDGPGPDHVSNVGILWSPTTGPGATYTKRHPVPFGEYIPLRSIARKVSKDVDLVARDMIAGTGNGLVNGAAAPLGDVICFEVAYDSLVRSSVMAGAQLLVVQTNNATFGHSAETYQQLAMSQLRAVEHGRAVLQVATSGKSAVIGPDGTIQQESGALFTPDRIVASVQTRTALTLATRLGALPEWVLTGLALLAAALALAASRTLGRHPAPAQDPHIADGHSEPLVDKPDSDRSDDTNEGKEIADEHRRQ
jgi:apolipoprotein N-acyltransferase